MRKALKPTLQPKKIETQEWLYIMIMESTRALNYIYFSFAHRYVRITLLPLLVVLFLKRSTLRTHKLVCLQSVYRCRKQPVSINP